MSLSCISVPNHPNLRIRKFYESLHGFHHRSEEFYRDFMVNAKNFETSEKVQFKPIRRFTDEYRNRLYYKTSGLQKNAKRVYYFLTLTYRLPNSYGEYLDRFRDRYGRAWSKLRSYFAKLGYKGLEFARVYELQKSGNLHAHVLIYSELVEKDINQLLLYWTRHYGHIKAYRYRSHISGMDGQTYAIKEQSWVRGEQLEWITPEWKKTSNLSTYLWKYLDKEIPCWMKSAYKVFRLRSYSISSSLKQFLNRMKNSSGSFTFTHFTKNDQIIDRSPKHVRLTSDKKLEYRVRYVPKRCNMHCIEYQVGSKWIHKCTSIEPSLN